MKMIIVSAITAALLTVSVAASAQMERVKFGITNSVVLGSDAYTSLTLDVDMRSDYFKLAGVITTPFDQNVPIYGSCYIEVTSDLFCSFTAQQFSGILQVTLDAVLSGRLTMRSSAGITIDQSPTRISF